MGQLEKYGLYVMCLVIFLILGVTLWGDPANASKTRAKKEAAMHASLGDSTSGLQNASFDRGTQRRDEGRRSGEISSLLGPEENPPKYSSADDGNLPQGGGVIGDLINSNSANSRDEVTKPVTDDVDEPVKTTPKPTPPASKRRTYKVRKGDSFARIARRELKSERHTALLMKLNDKISPSKLRIGQTLVLPTRSELGLDSFKSSNKNVATGAYRSYTVSKGDSFEKIARVELGSSKRVRELRAMNSNVDPRKLQIGQVIKLPLK